MKGSDIFPIIVIVKELLLFVVVVVVVGELIIVDELSALLPSPIISLTPLIVDDLHDESPTHITWQDFIRKWFNTNLKKFQKKRKEKTNRIAWQKNLSINNT